MASRRACLDALAPTLRRFASRAASSTVRPRAPVIGAPKSLPSHPHPHPHMATPSPRLLHPRHFASTPATRHGHLDTPKPGEERTITFIDKENQSHSFVVADGANLLDIAQAHDLEMEGACGGSCACSTCHVIVDDEAMYDKMDEPDDDENDMLDLAFGLTETSRLGCQVVMRKELDGLVVKLPRITRNLQASDFK
ncbi:mitochondrial matrix iron-sulfur protein [Pleosporales sp. CAS-2024a]